MTVGSLNSGQNLNFAVPAWTINNLPDIEIRFADLWSPESSRQESQESKPIKMPNDSITSEYSDFRGFNFGTSCREIAGRKSTPKRNISDYQIVEETSLFGAELSTTYVCDESFGLLEGMYTLVYADERFLAKVEAALEYKYGSGRVMRITKLQATDSGCSSYSVRRKTNKPRPKVKTWNVNNRLRIDILYCSGDHSGWTYLKYSDPILTEAFLRDQNQKSLDVL